MKKQMEPQDRTEEEELASVADSAEPDADSEEFSSADENDPLPVPCHALPAEAQSEAPSPDQEGTAAELDLILEPETEDSSLSPETVHRIGDVHHDEQASTPGTIPAEAQSIVEEPSPDQEGADELEDWILEPETEDSSLLPGTVHMIGDVHYVVEECLPRGYYRGKEENGDEAKSVLFHPNPRSHHALWLELDANLVHPRIPAILYRGEDGIVLEVMAGEPLGPDPMTLQDAVEHLHGVVQLMTFLATKQAVMTDIDPAGFRRTEDTGLRLQFLPAISPLGKPAQVCFGDGMTPIQGSETEYATEATNVFLWGAMLYWLTTGKFLSAEGLHMMALSQLQEPGLPQLLSVSMLHPDQCPDLRTLREHYRAYRVDPVPRVPRYQIGAASTVGLNPTRLCNEDSHGFVHHYWEYHEGHMQLIRACVADGMGGEEAGEVASQAGVHAFCHHGTPLHLDQPDTQASWTRELGWVANEAVMDALDHTSGGCTLTGIVVVGNRLTLAHVGDSRAYLYSPEHDGLQRLSRDHSLVQTMVDSGNMTEDEAAHSPDINQVTRALGTARRAGLHPEYVDSLSSLVDQEGTPMWGEWLDLNAGDLILLMSDGIWGSWEYRETVISEELRKVILESKLDPQETADALIGCALESGADDNATILVIQRVQ